MLPEPRRPPRDVTKSGSEAPKGKGKGKGKNKQQTNPDKNGGKGNDEYPPLQASAQARPKAKATSGSKPGPTPAPWAEADDAEVEHERLYIDKRRISKDPVYRQQMRVVLERTMNQQEALAQAEEQLEQVRARHEAELPPDKRLTALRKRLRIAEASEAKIEAKVNSTQEEIDAASDRLHEFKLNLKAQKTRTSAIKEDIQATEALLQHDSKGVEGETADGKTRKTPMTLAEHLECVFQIFKGTYKLSEEESHSLESQLSGIENLSGALERVAAVHEAEEKLEEERRAQTRAKMRAKRDRSWDEESVTPVAESEADEMEVIGAEATAADIAGPPQGQPAAAPDAGKPIIGPVATTHSSVQAPSVTPTAKALPRADRERSPRRDTEQVTVPVSEEEVIPPLTAKQDAALRGDLIDTLDSLPELEEAPQDTASNPRGGATLT
jgi:hypothetical protein